MNTAIKIDLPDSSLKKTSFFQVTSPIKYFKGHEEHLTIYVKIITILNGESVFTQAYPSTPSGKILYLDPLIEIEGNDHLKCLDKLGFCTEDN